MPWTIETSAVVAALRCRCGGRRRSQRRYGEPDDDCNDGHPAPCSHRVAPQVIESSTSPPLALYPWTLPSRLHQIQVKGRRKILDGTGATARRPVDGEEM